ncbi:SGNH/GDSL hydrolase family protein [Bacillus sp. DTU_2020_1000418_1_SI_GHA_SEK_038]|uniref:SGNH/GDSL hydrolase family protein n=1 Tax=Bacillus sp. DTU_2020_1000418_1_SI_GHA_SEK_038 TaxID=3077585 RepID=UPI0028EACB60|nr:SGNH/GDSL hydrolase family protein [Bacillus sp. DTU_2020_1000418_1_SI_GHA_SEK_038]WNS75217.1 SGNH/GDSL hydrolase family protein [Bacillus sp. DTU_2020_1000418_1_SI_GHA_SEK_038]
MKAFFVALLAICCATLLVIGNIHWDKKTTVAGQTEAIKIDNKEYEEVESAAASINPKELLVFANNWPEKSKEQFRKALEEERPFHILIVGSESMGVEKNGWHNLVRAAVKETYGETVTIETLEYEMNSHQFVQENKQKDLIEQKADMIIIEPFTYKDNGKVRIEDSLANLTRIRNDVKNENQNVEFVIQPPHPLFNARYYPIQVEELKEYSEKRGITYLDHWTAWPDWHTEEIKDYLLEDSSGPSEKGHEAWAEYLEKFLVSK